MKKIGLNIVTAAAKILHGLLLLSVVLYLIMPQNAAVRAAAAVLVVLQVIAAAAALYLRRFGVKNDDRRRLTVSGEGGDVQVSMAAIETIARRAAGERDGVKDIAVTAEDDGDALDVRLTLTVSERVRLPELTDKMRDSVRETIETLTGRTVRDVSVLVSEIEPENAGKAAK